MKRSSARWNKEERPDASLRVLHAASILRLTRSSSFSLRMTSLAGPLVMSSSCLEAVATATWTLMASSW